MKVLFWESTNAVKYKQEIWIQSQPLSNWQYYLIIWWFKLPPLYCWSFLNEIVKVLEKLFGVEISGE